MPTRELFDLLERNHDWEKAKYPVPAMYQHPSFQHIPAKAEKHKETYVDSLLQEKKQIPAPNKYRPQTAQALQMGKIGKDQRKTPADQVI